MENHKEFRIRKIKEELVFAERWIALLQMRAAKMQEELSQAQSTPVNEAHEEKQIILSRLKNLLQCTRAGSGIKSLLMDESEDYVIILFEGGTKRVPVMGDSGIALIQDVIKCLLR